ncbi:hypothetical protein [Candidatus Brocadia sinica]|nr:hypothetical protein [Candidatus Brocadia sinica]
MRQTVDGGFHLRSTNRTQLPYSISQFRQYDKPSLEGSGMVVFKFEKMRYKRGKYVLIREKSQCCVASLNGIYS